MKQLYVGLTLMIALTACTAPKPQRTSQVLFNERDLTGWVVMHGGEWSVENGVLVGRNGTNWSTNPEISGSWLRSERLYQNFILDLEYLVEGNSGIFIRSGLEKNPAFTGYEMQALSDAGRAPSKSSAGALYDVVAPSRNMTRPAGQWNQLRILAEGPRIQIILNDELVVDYDEASRSPSGYIGFQNHDDKAVFRLRNVRLTEL